METKLVSVEEIKARPAPESESLADSIGLVGQRDPINVRPIKENGYLYEIASGNRRYWSLVAQGQEEVWVVILDADDMQFCLDALVLNSGTPNFMDESDQIRVLIEEYGYTKEEVSRTVGLSLSTVQSRVDLYEKLIEEFRGQVRLGHIKYSATIDLVKLPKHRQELFWGRMQAEIEVEDRTGITIRDCQQEYRDYKNESILDLLPIVQETPKIQGVSNSIPEDDQLTPLHEENTTEREILVGVASIYQKLSERSWAARTAKGDRAFLEEVVEELRELLTSWVRGT